ncbi:MAG: hypothetical protein E7456_03620 [Ruminococcaceae bacterium]|nr:hypothetical protein [Oscillospiraceae bacterium]
MLKGKKILSLVMILALLASMMTPFAFAAEVLQNVSYPDTIFSCDNIVIDENGTATLNVYITNNLGLIGYHIYLEGIDNEQFTIESVKRGNFTSLGSVVSNIEEFNNKESEVFNAIYYYTGENITNDGCILTVTLSAKPGTPAGTYPITVSYGLTNTLFNHTNDPSVIRFPYIEDIQCVNGSITVEHVWDDGTNVSSECVEGESDTLYTCTICGEQRVEPGVNAHTWDEGVVTAPTCTTDGYTLYTCSNCQKTRMTDIIEGGHSMGSWTQYKDTVHRRNCENCTYYETAKHNLTSTTVAPTCTEDGSTTYTCSDCGYTYSEVIPATGHSFGSWFMNGDAGHIRYCNTCGAGETVPHEYSSVVTEPTCQEGGYTTNTCTICNYTMVNNETDVIPHTCTTVVTEPTCQSGGYTTYTCTICGETYIGNETEPSEHDYLSIVTAPTCSTGGYTTYICRYCDDTYIGDETDPIPHTYEDVVTPPTCNAQGYTTHTCTVCGEYTVDTYVDATGEHTYEAEVIAPSCTAGGYTIYTCSVCGESYTANETEVIDHTYDEGVVTAPNCTEQGYTTYTCTVCGESYIGDYTDATGTEHSYEAISTTPPTCGEQGYTTYTCSVCGDVYNGDFTDPTGEHEYDSVVTEPTCTEGGYTTYTCTVCGDSHIANEISAAGHNSERVVTPPTCTEEGFTSYICTVCGDTYVTNRVPAAGHSYEDVVTEPTCQAGGCTTHTCSVCGDTYVDSETEAIDHIYEATVVEPTVGVGGYTLYTCTMCGESYQDNFTDPLPAPDSLLGDVDDNGVVNNADLVLLARYIVHAVDSIPRADNADLTGDGSIANADLVELAILIVNQEH